MPTGDTRTGWLEAALKGFHKMPADPEPPNKATEAEHPLRHGRISFVIFRPGHRQQLIGRKSAAHSADFRGRPRHRTVRWSRVLRVFRRNALRFSALRFLVTSVRFDLGTYVIGRERIQTAPLRPGPGLLQPVGRRRRKADEILDADDDDRGLAPAVDDEALVVPDGKIHDLPELSAGDVGVDAAFHGPFNALIG
jgi:hypothetical protein